jgi:hypothetical protein
MSWPAWNRTSVASPRSKRGGPADRATGHRSPSPGSNWAGCPYEGPPDAGPKGIVSPARFERALPTSSRWCLLPLGYEDIEPPPGADPGHPPYESGAAAVRGGKAGHPGFEPGNSGFRARRVCQIPPMAIECGRRESNAQAARFEVARYSGSLHSRMVRHLGLEPRPDTG